MPDNIATYSGGLPDTMEDLAHFLLIAPEKAAARKKELIGQISIYDIAV